MDYKQRLKELREDVDLTQRALGEELNIKHSAVSKYESGLTQPSIETIIKIAGIFKVSVDYLLGVSSVKNPYSKEEFSPKEAELINKYRKLSKEDQIRIDERISMLLDSSR